MSVHLKKRERIIKGGRNRKSRAKTFTSEESAHTYAKANGLSKYSLENMKSSTSTKSKIRIVE